MAFCWHSLYLNVSICVFVRVWVDRNLSSVNERTRQKMRDMQGLVDSLVSYIQQEERADDKVTLTILACDIIIHCK